MGRQLVLQLAKAGASSAFCDVHPKAIDETVRLAKEVNPNVRVTGHIADVTKESDWLRFRDETLKAHDRDHVNLAFMNAGIGGGGSFIKSSREEWDRTFDICWNGVLHGSRTFLPLLIAAKEGWVRSTCGFREANHTLTFFRWTGSIAGKHFLGQRLPCCSVDRQRNSSHGLQCCQVRS